MTSKNKNIIYGYTCELKRLAEKLKVCKDTTENYALSQSISNIKKRISQLKK